MVLEKFSLCCMLATSFYFRKKKKATTNPPTLCRNNFKIFRWEEWCDETNAFDVYGADTCVFDCGRSLSRYAKGFCLQFFHIKMLTSQFSVPEPPIDFPCCWLQNSHKWNFLKLLYSPSDENFCRMKHPFKVWDFFFLPQSMHQLQMKIQVITAQLGKHSF